MNKKEKEIIAQIRNDFTPILNYFKLREEVKNSELRPEQKEDLYSLIEQEDDNSQEHAKKIKKLLDSLG